ncbi:kinase-like protein [Rhizophagus irregularis]|uniref:Kinase-like protein n=1 Tax=Rhizophagus irregularis TaxID=588596 RepID=A0A2N1NNN0_9GLOM|nr:kinase-like protein [Rhizophagus irregularis]
MSVIREEFAHAAIARSLALIDYNVHNDIHKRHEFQKQTVLADNSLTEDEKTYAINWMTRDYDYYKILDNSGTKRICENCKQECLATLYCEFCVRNYLKAKFSNWTSGNVNIDNLIQKCQLETLIPSKITVEWIPYNNLQDIKYLTKGGFSEIYTANWIDGRYEEWNSKNQQLIRSGNEYVILKSLENVKSANQSWFEEAKSHLTIGNKRNDIVRCYGLTQNISNGNYMLVMMKMDINLREYLYQNHNKLTWKGRINITYEIISALYIIHEENSIHRDLHSGNILYSELNSGWYISDLGFCGPADKSSKCIYGNLPYIAPEVINGKEYTFKSDIYSIAMLMWEISSGQPPFINHEHDYDLVMNIINGIRPKIVLGTPTEYKNLMEQCWDADPSKRPDTDTLSFHSKSYDFSIPANINDFNKPRNQSNNNTSKLHSIFNANSKNLSKTFEKLPIKDETVQQTKGPNVISDSEKLPKEFINLQIKSNKIIKQQMKRKNIDSDDDEKEVIQQKMKRQNINDIDDDDEMYNNPNLHSEEQDELEIPDDGF